MTMAIVIRRTVIAAAIVAPLLALQMHAAAPVPVQIYPPPPATGGSLVIAVLADHYTAGEQKEFEIAARNIINYSLLSDSYYAPKAGAFKILTMFEAWTASTSTPSSNYGFELGAGVSNCSIHWANNTTTLIESVVRTPLNPAITIVIGNYDYNFGCKQDNWVYVAAGSFGDRILEHELGHALANLWDEFSLADNMNTVYPGVADHGNCSTLTPPQWMPLTGATNKPECALFGQGIVRPFDTCRMRTGGETPFCKVCTTEMDGAFDEYLHPASPLPTDSLGERAVGRPGAGPRLVLARFDQPPASAPSPSGGLSMLVRVNKDTGATSILSTSEISGPIVPHYRRVGDYVYEIMEGQNTVASSVIPGNPFQTHPYTGAAAPHTAPPTDGAFNITIPGVNKMDIARGARVLDITIWRLEPGIGPDAITPSQLTKLKALGKCKQIGQVPSDRLKDAVQGIGLGRDNSERGDQGGRGEQRGRGDQGGRGRGGQTERGRGGPPDRTKGL